MTVSEDAEGFPKRARIRRRREYLRVQRVAERCHGAHFVVLKAPTNAAHCRVGITVSSKVGNAVVRNRVKRLVREILRRRWRALAPVDLVIVARPAAAQVSYAVASMELGESCGWRA